MRTSRRGIVAAVWALPVLAAGLPTLLTSTTLRTTASLAVSASSVVAVDAVARAHPAGRDAAVLREGYGRGRLPHSVTVTNDRTGSQWFRLRVLDDLTDFRVTVDGGLATPVSRRGFGAPFLLGPASGAQGSRTLSLNYRTAAELPYSRSTSLLGPTQPDQFRRVRIAISVQRFEGSGTPSSEADDHGWALVAGGMIFVAGTLWRTRMARVDFTVTSPTGDSLALHPPIRHSR